MQNTDYAEIGRRIRRVRKMQNLTQEMAAEKCDITAAYYGHIERGDQKLSVETLAKVSIGLKISVDYLLFGDEQDKLAEYLSEIQQTVDEKQMEKYLTIIKAVAGVIDKL